MCPQQPYYKAFISHKNLRSPTQTLFANGNHQRAFLKQKIVTLHRCGFNLKFPKHCYFDRYFG